MLLKSASAIMTLTFPAILGHNVNQWLPALLRRVSLHLLYGQELNVPVCLACTTVPPRVEKCKQPLWCDKLFYTISSCPRLETCIGDCQIVVVQQMRLLFVSFGSCYKVPRYYWVFVQDKVVRRVLHRYLSDKQIGRRNLERISMSLTTLRPCDRGSWAVWFIGQRRTVPQLKLRRGQRSRYDLATIDTHVPEILRP